MAGPAAKPESNDTPATPSAAPPVTVDTILFRMPATAAKPDVADKPVESAPAGDATSKLQSEAAHFNVPAPGTSTSVARLEATQTATGVVRNQVVDTASGPMALKVSQTGADVKYYGSDGQQRYQNGTSPDGKPIYTTDKPVATAAPSASSIMQQQLKQGQSDTRAVQVPAERPAVVEPPAVRPGADTTKQPADTGIKRPEAPVVSSVQVGAPRTDAPSPPANSTLPRGDTTGKDVVAPTTVNTFNPTAANPRSDIPKAEVPKAEVPATVNPAAVAKDALEANKARIQENQDYITRRDAVVANVDSTGRIQVPIADKPVVPDKPVIAGKDVPPIVAPGTVPQPPGKDVVVPKDVVTPKDTTVQPVNPNLNPNNPTNPANNPLNPNAPTKGDVPQAPGVRIEQGSVAIGFNAAQQKLAENAAQQLPRPGDIKAVDQLPKPGDVKAVVDQLPPAVQKQLDAAAALANQMQKPGDITALKPGEMPGGKPGDGAAGKALHIDEDLAAKLKDLTQGIKPGLTPGLEGLGKTVAGDALAVALGKDGKALSPLAGFMDGKGEIKIDLAALALNANKPGANAGLQDVIKGLGLEGTKPGDIKGVLTIDAKTLSALDPKAIEALVKAQSDLLIKPLDSLKPTAMEGLTAKVDLKGLDTKGLDAAKALDGNKALNPLNQVIPADLTAQMGKVLPVDKALTGEKLPGLPEVGLKTDLTISQKPETPSLKWDEGKSEPGDKGATKSDIAGGIGLADGHEAGAHAAGDEGSGGLHQGEMEQEGGDDWVKLEEEKKLQAMLAGKEDWELAEKKNRKDSEESELEEELRNNAKNAMLAGMLAQTKEQELAEKERQFLMEEAIRKGQDKRKKYLVKDKDTLESIAKKQLRDVRLSALIYEINKHMLPVRMEKGKQVVDPRAGTSIWLPSEADIKEFRSRLYAGPRTMPNLSASGGGGGGHSAGAAGMTAEQELAAQFGANWDGKSRGAASNIGAGMMGAAVAKSQVRRTNIEKILGPMGQKTPESARIRYIVRLGDTLDGVASKHPALKDAELWPLLASINELTADVDDNEKPVAVLRRGMVLNLPTQIEIDRFNAVEEDEGEDYNDYDDDVVSDEMASAMTGSVSQVLSATRSHTQLQSVSGDNLLRQAASEAALQNASALAHAQAFAQSQNQESQSLSPDLSSTGLAEPVSAFEQIDYEDGDEDADGDEDEHLQESLNDIELVSPAVPAAALISSSVQALQASQTTQILPTAPTPKTPPAPPKTLQSLVPPVMPLPPAVPQATSQPVITQPQTQPQITQPQITQPQISQPQMSQPQPQTFQPQISQPQISQPQISQPVPSHPVANQTAPTPSQTAAAAPGMEVLLREPVIAGDRLMWELYTGIRLVKSSIKWEPAIGVFRAQLEMLIGGVWYPVIFYEAFPTGAVRHEYTPGGKRKSVRIDLPPAAVQELADNDLVSKWTVYCRAYLSQIQGPNPPV